MSNQSIEKIINNLSKVEYDFAYDIVHSSFKGNQKNLLLKFINKEISEDYVKAKWNQLNLSGKLLDDVKLEELNLLDRLKLINYLINKLGVANDYAEFYSTSLISDDDCCKALAMLIYDVTNKSGFRVRNKETLASLLDLIRKDKTQVNVPVQECLIPHEPEIDTEEMNIEEEEEEIGTKDLEALSI